MSLDKFTEKVRKIVGNDCGVGAKAKFVTPEGVVYVDATQVPNIVSNEDLPADCNIKISLENALDLMDGNLNVMSAFMFGKIKIDGDMGLAMRIAKMVG